MITPLDFRPIVLFLCQPLGESGVEAAKENHPLVNRCNGLKSYFFSLAAIEANSFPCMQKNHQILMQLAAEILERSQAYDAGEIMEDGLPTAQELARKLKLKHDFVKKKLKILAHQELIRPITYNPKRYRLDRYLLDHSDETQSLREFLLSSDETETEPEDLDDDD